MIVEIWDISLLFCLIDLCLFWFVVGFLFMWSLDPNTGNKPNSDIVCKDLVLSVIHYVSKRVRAREELWGGAFSFLTTWPTRVVPAQRRTRGMRYRNEVDMYVFTMNVPYDLLLEIKWTMTYLWRTPGIIKAFIVLERRQRGLPSCTYTLGMST